MNNGPTNNMFAVSENTNELTSTFNNCFRHFSYLFMLCVHRAAFLQRRSREVLDNDELQVCGLYFVTR